MNCRNETNFWIGQAIHQTRFTDRTQVREFTLDDFIGTCGGYIGMFLGIGLSQLPAVLMNTIKGMKKSKPKLEGTLRKYTIRRGGSRCYNNSSVVLKKQTANECQQSVERLAVPNGQDEHLYRINSESSHFLQVRKSCLKPSKDAITTRVDQENETQTRAELQMRILKLEDKLEKISNSLNNKYEHELEVT